MKATKNDKGIQFRRRLKYLYYGIVDTWRYVWRLTCHGNCNYHSTQMRFLNIIVANYHVIEKSLTMPQFELGHGIPRLSVLVADLLLYQQLGYDTSHIQYISAVRAVDEYYTSHCVADYVLPEDLVQSIKQLLSSVKYMPLSQPTTTAEQFFDASHAPFAKFALSRHSLRAYADTEISLSVLEQVVSLARTTPTPCNRQPNKTYIVTSKNMIRQVACLQGGGIGFVDKADKLLVITSRVDVFGSHEIYEVWKSGGMYAMNLLYALHYHSIGACPLEWNGRDPKDKQLRTLLHIPQNEEIIMILSIGYPLAQFKYVASARNDVKESMVVI